MPHSFLLILSLLLLSCTTSTNKDLEESKTYSVDENVWMKDSSEQGIFIPEEFVAGTANWNNLMDWSFVYFSYLDQSLQRENMLVDSVDVNHDKKSDFLFTQVRPAQNSLNFLFKKGNKGYSYLGQINASQYKIVICSTEPNYILTTQHVSANAQVLELYSINQSVLEKKGQSIQISKGQLYKEENTLLTDTNLIATITSSEPVIKMAVSNLKSIFQF